MIRWILIGSVLCWMIGCNKAPSETPRELRVLCGSSMAEPGQEIGRMFKQRHGPVAMDLGGSETLLPRILSGADADVFICHDPFEQKVKEADKWAGSATVATMMPVILVGKGNPKNIRTLADLARADVRLGIGRPSESTCGQMFVDMLRQRKLYEKVIRPDTREFRTHAELANGLMQGALDAVVVWNFIAVMYKDKVQLVDTDAKYEPVRVTVVGLKQSVNPQARDQFLEMCRSQTVRDLFSRYGYGQP